MDCGCVSSITAAMSKQLNRKKLYSFSVEFTIPEFDENAFQQEVVRRLGTEHHTGRCSHRDIGRIFS